MVIEVFVDTPVFDDAKRVGGQQLQAQQKLDFLFPSDTAIFRKRRKKLVEGAGCYKRFNSDWIHSRTVDSIDKNWYPPGETSLPHTASVITHSCTTVVHNKYYNGKEQE